MKIIIEYFDKDKEAIERIFAGRQELLVSITNLQLISVPIIYNKIKSSSSSNIYPRILFEYTSSEDEIVQKILNRLQKFHVPLVNKPFLTIPIIYHQNQF
jgi:hypothetical protein